jgi:hypothetical protein
MKYLGEPKSGSQAGTTASRNRFGQYYRNRRAPVQPRTAAQLAVRDYLTTNTKAWGTLTNAQRAAWAAYASAHPTVDSLGSSITLTGAQMFVGVNALALAAGQATQTAPPSGAAVATPSFVFAFSGAANFDLVITDENPGTVIVYSSPPVSSGVNFNGDFRIVSITDAPGPGDDLCTASQLTAKWGTLVAGQKFIFKVRSVLAGNRSSFASGEVVLS